MKLRMKLAAVVAFALATGSLHGQSGCGIPPIPPIPPIGCKSMTPVCQCDAKR